MLNGERLKASLLNTRARQSYPPSPFFINIVLKTLAGAIRPEIEKEVTCLGKEGRQLSWFADDTIL